MYILHIYIYVCILLYYIYIHMYIYMYNTTSGSRVPFRLSGPTLTTAHHSETPRPKNCSTQQSMRFNAWRMWDRFNRSPRFLHFLMWNKTISPVHVPPGKRLHNYVKSPFLMGKSTINGPFSIAMLNYQRVLFLVSLYFSIAS